LAGSVADPPRSCESVRRGVEGKRHGWQRLHRFQQLAAHPSVNSTAHALNLHTSNLLLQLDRLEADIGATLIHRTNHRYQSMTLTRRGQRLLNPLNQPAARQQLDRHAHSDRTLS
jgi:DNA-binding transcriptional LysR family regulator